MTIISKFNGINVINNWYSTNKSWTLLWIWCEVLTKLSRPNEDSNHRCPRRKPWLHHLSHRASMIQFPLEAMSRARSTITVVSRTQFSMTKSSYSGSNTTSTSSKGSCHRTTSSTWAARATSEMRHFWTTCAISSIGGSLNSLNSSKCLLVLTYWTCCSSLRSGQSWRKTKTLLTCSILSSNDCLGRMILSPPNN